jgi:hypothetical protein
VEGKEPYETIIVLYPAIVFATDIPSNDGLLQLAIASRREAQPGSDAPDESQISGRFKLVYETSGSGPGGYRG